MAEQDKEYVSLKCPFCGGDLQWESDEYQEDDAAVASYYLCSRCGRDYEIVEPNEEARNNEYKEYWKS